MITFGASTKPCSFRPLRKPAIDGAFGSSDPMPRYPTTGIVGAARSPRAATQRPRRRVQPAIPAVRW